MAGQEVDLKDKVIGSKGDLNDAKDPKDSGLKADLKDPGSNRIRGWFPRKCAVELADNLQSEDESIVNNKKKESKKIK